MKEIHPQYVVDEEGVPRSVVLEIGEFRNLLESAGVCAQEPGGSGPSLLKNLGWTREEALDTRIRLHLRMTGIHRKWTFMTTYKNMDVLA